MGTTFVQSAARLLSSVVIAALTVPAPLAGGSDEVVGPGDAIDFRRDVRPILSMHCFPCHGPDAAARKAGLRLDRSESALGPLRDGGFAVVGGDAGASRLVARITAIDPGERMPPADSGRSLTRDQVDLLRAWIEDGAEWTRHWAYVPPARVEPGAVRDDRWCRDPIDRYVLARLERERLGPSAEADRATLLRRVTFDLTGLPPSLDEIDAFLADDRPGAYERVVDRLLAAPAYGERMATDWLDLARYADSYGYQNDVDSAVWPYRDWVVRAFNDNLPYDEFITWQLAGDLLPAPSRDQRLATAFNRLHRQTNEGGSVEEEFRVEYVADRVNTFGTAVLGLTLECARCHDHKFDPISQAEYYRLSAFFNSIDESGLYSHFTPAVPTPTLLLTTPEEDDELDTLRRWVTAAETALDRLRRTRRTAYERWLGDERAEPVIGGLVGDYPLDAVRDGALLNRADETNPGAVADDPTPFEGVRGSALRLDGENKISLPGVGAFTRTDPFSIALWLRVPEHTDRAVVLHRSRSWTDAGSQGYQLLIEDGRLSWSLVHFWPGNAIGVQAVDPLELDRWTHVTVTYDGSSRASGLSLRVDGVPADTRTVRDNLFKRITGGGPGPLTIGQRFRDRGLKGGAVDEVQVFDRCLTPIEARHVFDGRALADAAAARADDLYPYYLANHDAAYRDGLETLRLARRELADALDGTSEIMTMTELPAPRPAFLLERGRYDARRERVRPGTPPSIMAFSAGLRPDRLGLARWATDPEHPLTARVAVNRLWMIVFGRGLVATAENFGSQGVTPTHPELLDALALDFIASGWDVKRMLKRMVTSATYRQRSAAAPARRERDPENVLLSRGPSRRLGAEMIRDHALAASGLLVRRMGGPGTYPYQPPGLWEEKSGKVYPRGEGESLHRRSLYTFWKRTSPPPSMMIFDAAKRDVCIARRGTTSTPLQALVLLNDLQFVEAARVLAERACREAGPSPAQRIALAFRLLAGRRPSERELAVLTRLHDRELAGFRDDPAAALAVAQAGEAPATAEVPPDALAALTIVCSTIMNSDVSVMKR
jgi:mono/diheme cytochrome c family protein